MSKKFFTVKEWTIDKSKTEDMAIKIVEDGVEIKYDIPMEEAMTVIATIKKDVRHNPNCDFFEIHFGGKRHGFSRVGIIKFCEDLKVVVNECLAIRVFGTRTFRMSNMDNADTNYLKMPETVSTSPKEPDLSEAVARENADDEAKVILMSPDKESARKVVEEMAENFNPDPGFVEKKRTRKK